MRVMPDERWLAAMWPFVRRSLPAPPIRVAEQAAIETGQIQANRINYVASKATSPAPSA